IGSLKSGPVRICPSRSVALSLLPTAVRSLPLVRCSASPLTPSTIGTKANPILGRRALFISSRRQTHWGKLEELPRSPTGDSSFAPGSPDHANLRREAYRRSPLPSTVSAARLGSRSRRGALDSAHRGA